jgi:hypothetical protein
LRKLTPFISQAKARSFLAYDHNDSKLTVKKAMKEYKLQELTFKEISDFFALDDEKKYLRKRPRKEKEVIEHYTEILK